MTTLYKIPTSRICTGCKDNKTEDNFSRRKRLNKNSDIIITLQPRCKSCRAAHQRSRYTYNHIPYSTERYHLYKGCISKAKKKYYLKNKSSCKV